VVVVEDGQIGGGMTGRTTAHLASALDDRFYELERLHGSRGAQLAADSHAAAIDRIEAIVAELDIDCGFERLDGYLFAPPGEPPASLQEELNAARRAGLSSVEMVARAPLEPFDTGPCLRFPNQAQLHPLNYLAGLAAAVRRAGGRIFTFTHVTGVEGGARARVTTRGGHSIAARAIVVATNTPINDRVVIHTKQAPYLTYVVAARVPRDSVARALYWDTADPYHYVRLAGLGDGAGRHDLLIVGGEDHKTGQAADHDERFARLASWAGERFAAIARIEYRWSGQVMEPVDGLAFIGRNPADEDNVYVATGDSSPASCWPTSLRAGRTHGPRSTTRRGGPCARCRSSRART
jgi:glycine/D-amino acid oxidase-like deaminating enzyme